MTEADLLAAVLHLCEQYHVLAFHSTDSRRDVGRGFPDLLIAGPHGVMFIELKTDFGQLSSAQITWRYRLIAADEVWRLWRPEDLRSGAIERAVAAIA